MQEPPQLLVSGPVLSPESACALGAMSDGRLTCTSQSCRRTHSQTWPCWGSCRICMHPAGTSTSHRSYTSVTPFAGIQSSMSAGAVLTCK